MSDPSVAVVTGGHPFDQRSFFALFDQLCPGRWRPVTTPVLGCDVVVFYDMPGLRFTRSEPPVELIAPTPAEQQLALELTMAGRGLVFLHHALASWPAWPAYAELVGGRFHYVPGTLAGATYPDSGYRHGVTHTVEVLDRAHPVCAGVPPSFAVTDELYCAPVLHDVVLPLLRTRFPVHDCTEFYSARRAVSGHRDDRTGWSHPPGSDLVGWALSANLSPVVYLQFGDGPSAYDHPVVRRLLANAIEWTASADARDWAGRRARPWTIGPGRIGDGAPR